MNRGGCFPRRRRQGRAPPPESRHRAIRRWDEIKGLNAIAVAGAACWRSTLDHLISGWLHRTAQTILGRRNFTEIGIHFGYGGLPMLKKRASFWLAMFVAAALLSLALACGGGNKETTNDGGAKPTGGKYSGGVGGVSGKTAFNGTAPAPKKIDSSADPVCGQKNPNLSTEDIIVTDGKLANVFVY